MKARHVITATFDREELAELLKVVGDDAGTELELVVELEILSGRTRAFWKHRASILEPRRK